MRGVRYRKLYRADLAELLGVAVNSLDRIRDLPERDGTDIEAGKARPYWFDGPRLRRWMGSRPGKGWRAGQRKVAS